MFNGLAAVAFVEQVPDPQLWLVGADRSEDDPESRALALAIARLSEWKIRLDSARTCLHGITGSRGAAQAITDISRCNSGKRMLPICALKFLVRFQV